MAIVVREANANDKDRACYVEGRSTPNLRYLEPMWESFTSSPDEPLYIAEVDGVVAGLGKFSILYDGSAWLETLRVDPDYQGQGLGKAIYRSYLAQAKKLGAPAIRMYTGLHNAASAGLARINGFNLVGQYSGADLDVLSKNKPSNVAEFLPVTEQMALELLRPFAAAWEGFMILNRTFYKMNDELYRGLAKDGMVYYNAQSSSIIVIGSRFLPERGLHIGLYEGDTELCLDFALAKANDAGISKLSIMFPPALTNVKDDLLNYGFVMQKSDCIVMER